MITESLTYTNRPGEGNGDYDGFMCNQYIEGKKTEPLFRKSARDSLDLSIGKSSTEGVSGIGEKETGRSDLLPQKDLVPWTVSLKTDEFDYYPKPSSEFIRLMRAYYMEPIIDGLEKVQPFARSHQAAVFINQILLNIVELEEKSPDDLLLDVLYALYDALSANDNWTTYEADQYKRAIEVLKKYSDLSTLSQREIGKAIMELERIGFNTLPFVFELDDSVET